MKKTMASRYLLFLLSTSAVVAYLPNLQIRKSFASLCPNKSTTKNPFKKSQPMRKTELRVCMPPSLPPFVIRRNRYRFINDVFSALIGGVAFVASTLVGGFFRVLHSLMALALVTPMLIMMVAPIRDLFRVMEGPCPRCDENVRVMKVKQRGHCPHCGEPVELNQYDEIVPTNFEARYAQPPGEISLYGPPTTAFAAFVEDMVRRKRRAFTSPTKRYQQDDEHSDYIIDVDAKDDEDDLHAQFGWSTTR